MKTIEWDAACEFFELTLADNVRLDLEARYAEPHRSYHTLQHLDECIDRLAEVKLILDSRDCALLTLALWFHDAIYDTHRSDNEERSAEFARSTLLAGGASSQLADEVATLVLETKHVAPPSSPTAEWLVDIDLAILAVPAARFDEYEAQVRLEYQWVSDADFRTGRSRILLQFLSRPQLFATSYFRDRYEAAARANLQRSLATLGSHLFNGKP